MKVDFEYIRTASERKIMWHLIAIVAFICLLSIAFTDFNTKGEPREALVAHTMLTTGNWILPVDSAGDLAYKPPMFHWLVAIFSTLFGRLSEFTCRLPSAIALIVLVASAFRFYSSQQNRTNGEENKTNTGTVNLSACITALLTFTSFECFRAGSNCRVDMVLTAFMCGAIMSLGKLLVNPRFTWSIVAVLCMSGAALTKGPVGIILPLAIYWIVGLIRGQGFLRVSLASVLLLIAASILPALWYLAAYHMGGDRFLSLVIEENFGRMSGSMSYESHVKPVWYNFTSLITGWMPWTLLLLIAGTSGTIKHRFNIHRYIADRLHYRSIRSAIKSADFYTLYSAVAVVVIFIFFCLPKSKRSVYLLPLYPFMAYLLALMIRKMISCNWLKKTTIKWCMLAVFAAYLIGYAVVYPIIVNKKSDKLIAAKLTEMVPDEAIPIYAFVPDRFMRYYILNHYMGYRLISLLPSAQIGSGNVNPSAEAILMPKDTHFYILVSKNVVDGKDDYGLNNWILGHKLSVKRIFESERGTHDVKGRPVLLEINKPDVNTCEISK